MDAERIRRAPGSGARRGGGVVAAGSVWESRMKLDEVKGGIRVFNGDDGEVGPDENRDQEVKRSPIGGSVKRKTWKSETDFEGIKSSPVRVSKLRSDSLRQSSSDSEKGSIRGRRRSERIKELGFSLSASVDFEGDRSPVQGGRKLRSGVSRKANSVSGDVTVDEIDLDRAVDEPESNGNGGVGINGRDPVAEIEKEDGASETSKEQQQEGHGDEELEDDEFEDMEEEMESIDVKEINVPEQKPKKVVMAMANMASTEEKKIGKLNTKPVMAMASTARTHLPPLSPSPVIRRSTIHLNHQSTKPIPSPPVSDQCKRFPHTQNKLQSLGSLSILSGVVCTEFLFGKIGSDEHTTHQPDFGNSEWSPVILVIVDLVMWRDVSRSAFVFGIGTFVIISSSYTEDLNTSFISVISYVGLVYLAAIFLYKSIICRGVIDTYDDARYVVGEGDAVWLLKLFLPYLNEFLLKLRALFSGDPSTTMKLAVLLFVLARCGNSITIWKMAKFGFFGVFTLPKVCSSYSTHITAYGKFLVGRLRDAWASCSHKKAVAFAIFTLVWNLSSIVARVWAVFMLFVAIRYYQQCKIVRGDWEEDVSNTDTVESEEVGREAQNEGLGRQRNGPSPAIVELKKTKKGS